MNIDHASLTYRIIDGISQEMGYKGWVGMGHLRDECRNAGLSRQDLDAVLPALINLGIVDMVPEDNQKTLIDADQYNAIFVGGQNHHLIKLA